MNQDDSDADHAATDLTTNSSPESRSPAENQHLDARLYVPDHNDWDVQIKRDSERIYCYAKLPGQDWFHLILNGEIFVSRQHERYCLRCALRLNYLTQDRLFWQHRVPKKKTTI